jgi:hypothetical protein
MWFHVSDMHVLSGGRVKDYAGLGAWGNEWHSAETDESVFQFVGRNGVYEIPLGAITSVETPKPPALELAHRVKSSSMSQKCLP